MPPQPKLLFPTLIEIKKPDLVSTFWDEDAREAIQTIQESEVIQLQGQPSMMTSTEGLPIMSTTPTGIEEQGQAYILFRVLDLNRLSLSIEPNDRVIKIGHQAVDLYVKTIQPIGHYGRHNGSTFIRAYIEDRAPARNNPGQ